LESCVAPTPQCDAADMHGVDWNTLLNDDDVTTDDLLHGSSVVFDAASLSLTFSASLEYVGLSADGNFDDDYNLGSSYWIDFQSFSAGTGGIDEPGSCGNREAVDYSGLEFADSWTYPTNPEDLATVSTAERMAYSPSDWTIKAEEGCNVVEYERMFSWSELTACSDAEDSALVQVTQTSETVLLSGTFYVELVSPYSMSSSEYYRTAVLLQQDFSIALMRQVNVLASTGVDLFISSIMGYGRAADGSNYTMTILIQSAEYAQLGGVSAISWPDTVTVLDTESKTSGCLVASSFTCGQIFEVTIAAECIGIGEGTAVLTGNYQFGFTPECRVDDDGNTDDACNIFITSLDGNDVVLDADIVFEDDCAVDLFAVTFEGALDFYFDADFTLPATTASDPFVIGQDTIYGKVTVDIPSDSNDVQYDFVDVSIETIVVCTVDPDGDALTVDADTGTGGCFSSSIDADGPYYVFGNGAVEKYEGTLLDASGNEASFSFLTFDTPRTTIYVHVQLLLTMDTESGERRRRRVMLQTPTEGQGNAFQSYVGTATVLEAESTAVPVGTDGAAALSVGFVPALFVFIAGIFV